MKRWVFNAALTCQRLTDGASAKLWAELWWKHVPDGWGCNMETPSAELCSCRRDKHIVAFCRTKICPTRNAGNWDADIVEVGRTVLTDTVIRRDGNLELYSLWHWEPMKHVTKGQGMMCLYLPTPTTRRAAAFRTIWSRRMTIEEIPYRTPLQ